MFKGVAPVLAVVLLTVVTVGIVATTYHGISSLTKETQNKTGGTIEHQFNVMGAKLKVDVFGNCKIYLRNTGTKDVPIEIISFYADDKPIAPNPSTGIIKKNDVQEITFLNLNPKKYKLLVKIYGNTMDYGYLTCTGPAIACFSNLDCNDSNPCTTDICNNPGIPASSCSNTPTVACIDSDGCCPVGCAAINDSDCGAVCGDTVVEGTEECEYADLSGCVSPLHGTCDEITCSVPPCTCNYNLRCDSSTCAVGSADYNNYCVAPEYFACHVDTSCAVNETEILGLSAKDNAQAEIIGGGGGYSQKLCCSDISSVTTTTGKGTCGIGFTGLITLSSDTNAQVEKYNLSVGTPNFDYKKNVCVNLTSGGLECTYDTKANCDLWGYDKYVVSISSDTNAHIGDEDAYSIVRCCKEIS